MATFLKANEPGFLFKADGIELLVVSFKVEESISKPFFADLELASEKEIAFDEMVGQAGLLIMESGDVNRYLHGIVERFAQSGVNGRFWLYKAHLVPQLQLLALEQDCRIFQEKSVPDIVKQVLEESHILSNRFDFRLQGKYAPRDYCVQYRESDLAFISRLLEEEGIFYFFEHAKDQHLLVFGEGMVNYQPISGMAKVIFKPGGSMVSEEEAITIFELVRQVRSGKYSLQDFNYEKPSMDLSVDNTDADNKHLEVYDYPGEYLLPNEGKHLAQVRLQQAVKFKEQAQGKSVVPRLVPGFTFSLEEHDLKNLNQEYLLTEVKHEGAQPQVLAEKSAAGGGTRYANEFWAIPSSATFRPERDTARPRIDGVQTAIVTGPSGEEIYTDDLGRVKVQFHWDRRGKLDDKSSCWVRVSQLWAGAGWGAMFIPRVGQEVIVDFLEGDPDRPIITGSVYNGLQPPPYKLPEDKSKSTIMSNTTLGGGGSNEIRFEDQKGSEEIYLHGQKNWTIAIENDKKQTIGHDDSLSVGNNRTQDVQKDLSETVGQNKSVIVSEKQTEDIGKNKTLTVGEDSSEIIGKNYTLSVGDSKTVKIGKNFNNTVSKNISVDAGENLSENAGADLTFQSGKLLIMSAGGNMSISCDKKGVINIKDQLTIQCGNGSITIKKNGDIDIVGKKISIKGSSDVIVKGTSIKEN